MQKPRCLHLLLVLFTTVLLTNGPYAEAVNRESPIKLVLAISVDQMRYDYLERFRPLFKHGFKTLLENGAVFTQARYRHANTETGPGHAVLMSGRHASHSGIVSNGWYDSYLKKWVNVVEDPLQKPLGANGRAASPANFIGVTIGDVLKLRSHESRVVGVSAKDRGAVLMAGKNADGAFWFSPSDGKYMTSTYYFEEVPLWLSAWNAKGFVDSYFGSEWNRLGSDVAVYESFAGEDAAAGESDGSDIVFPHRLRGAMGQESFYESFIRTPFVDEMIADVVREAQEAFHLGEGRATDVLTISFSATDFIGHVYGPDSQEMMDQILRLDAVLGRLFSDIQSKVGLTRTLIMLSADHGVQPLVERLRAEGFDASRVHPAVIENQVFAALEKRFGSSKNLIAYAEAPNFWLNRDEILRRGLRIEQVEDEVISALKLGGTVEGIYRQADFLKDPPADDPYFWLHQNSFFASRSPDIIARTKPYIYVDDAKGGTGHSSPHEYDRHIPIIFMGPKVRPGVYETPCGPEDIAPTLARILALDLPKEEDARILSEMLRSKR